MAHKLSNGHYRHKGQTIKRLEIPSSTGWNIEWKVNHIRFDTLKQAVNYIDVSKAINTI